MTIRGAVMILLSLMFVLVLGLAYTSLQWPLVGDGAMFHFAAAQFVMGAVPYRDFFDMNMPLVYVLHVLIITLGGMSDLTFRLFDLGWLAAICILAAALVRPAGRNLAWLAALTIAAAHLLLGPPAAGERDYLLLAPLLTAAWCAARSAEKPDQRLFWLIGTGLATGTAIMLKPTAVLLLTLPFLAQRFRWRDAAAVVAGCATAGLITLVGLAIVGSVGWFVFDFRTFAPFYAHLAGRPLPVLVLLEGKYALLSAGGLAVAALFSLRDLHSPRVRIMIGLVAFGAIHFIAQGKGFFYHAYPLATALTCLGVWSLSRTPRPMALAVLAMSLAIFTVRGVLAFGYAQTPADQLMPSPVSTKIEAALESHLRRGARVQMLDMSGGAFLAMARAGMRQATPYAYWMFLMPQAQGWRDTFIATLRTDPPPAILLTNMTWPMKETFAAVDDWAGLKAELTCCYRLVDSGDVSGAASPWSASADTVSWRLYMKTSPGQAL